MTGASFVAAWLTDPVHEDSETMAGENHLKFHTDTRQCIPALESGRYFEPDRQRPVRRRLGERALSVERIRQ